MSKLNELSEAIDSIKAHQPTFSLDCSSSRGLRVNRTVAKYVKKEENNDESILYNLAVSQLKIGDSTGGLKLHIKKDETFNAALKEVRAYCLDTFCNVADNQKPKLTSTFKTLRSWLNREKEETIDNILISIYLYESKCGTNDVHGKNIFGLLNIVANKIKDGKFLQR